MRLPAHKDLLTIMLLALFAIGQTSCNKKSDEEVLYTYYSNNNTAVTAFSLTANDTILKHLDAVFFSIDLDNARIFNARPLPAGTDVSSLALTISTDECSVVELRYKTRWDNDTVVNYLDNIAAGVNFSNDNPVTLHVVSGNGERTRDYELTVNVYDQNPDNINWDIQASSYGFAQGTVKAEKTVHGPDGFYMLLDVEDVYYVVASADLYECEWGTPVEIVSLGFTPAVESFTIGADGQMYLLGSDNTLYSSADKGQTWVSTGQIMTYIYGSYGSSIVGCDTSAVTPMSVVYTPGSGASMTPVLDGMPVRGTSNMIVLNSSWEISPIAFFQGGVTAGGEYNGDTWGFDGTTWIKLSQTQQPAVEGRTLFNYTVAVTDSTTWRVTYIPVVMAMGGLKADGTIDQTLYYTNDMGVHWKQGPAYLQPSEQLPAVYGAQILTSPTTLYPVAGRAVAPVEQWECPYIYLYGGSTDQKLFNQEIWRGVMYRFTLEPLQ